jgi:uncharacterized protein YndB with AHSA1/START domain
LILQKYSSAQAELLLSHILQCKMSELVITRVFNAPRDVVFKAATEAEHLVHWWGGGADPIKVEQLDLIPGGKFLYGSGSSESRQWSYGLFVYTEVVGPEKISFVSGFADQDGNFIRAFFSESFPLQVLNTWTFSENEDGKSVLVLRGSPVEGSSAEEVDFFTNMIGMMQIGFGGTFDKLEAHLATL